MTNNKSILKQFQEENDIWKRSLEFLLHENVNLKNQLSGLLKERQLSPEFLQVAEQFQSKFIMSDEVINLMRHDVAELEKLLIRDIYEDGALIKKVTQKHKKLHKELKTLKKTFDNLKRDFNNYL